MNTRLGSVTAAMIAIAVLIVLLGMEAVRTARAQRATAERVLTDYAGLGAEGVANRLQGFVAGRLFPILDRVKDPAPPTLAALTDGLEPGQRALAERVPWTGRVAGTGPMRVARYDAAVRTAADIADSVRAAARRLPDYAYFGMFARDEQLLVFGPLRGTPVSSAVYGLPLDGIAINLQSFLDRDPILPASLLPDDPLGDRIAVTISLDGRPLAVRGSTRTSSFKGVHSLGVMFGGMTVEVRLMDELASSLVTGGLARSRLPFLAAMMTFAIALAILTIRQVRQRDRLARLREDFVASASHELRTPLAQIRLFAETLRLGRVRSEDERDHAVAVMEREARRLEHLVENLLNSSRSGRGSLSVSPESVDLAALTRELVAEYAPLASKAGVTIQVEAPRALSARVDPAAWRQIVVNLLDNAAKYGPRGGRVSVGLATDGAYNRLSVTDEGPGVPPTERERIWERFWRGDAARAAGVTGTGVGLATVRHLVRLMEGECWVENASPTGARFAVRTPGAT